MVRAASLARTEPETAEELAALKKENSRRYRQRQTTINLVLALAASLGVMLLFVLVVVRPEGSQLTPVDYRTVAADLQQSREWPIAAPDVPEAWSANVAEIRTDSSDRGQFFYIGFITDEQTFVSLSQREGADETWAIRALGGVVPTGTVVIDGVTWQVYDRREDPEAGNTAYALSADLAGTTIILAGTATEEQAAELARLTVASVMANPLAPTPLAADQGSSTDSTESTPEESNP